MEDIRLGMDKAFIEGLKIMNQTYRKPAGSGLKKGFPETMTVYNKNLRVVKKMEKELDERISKKDESSKDKKTKKSLIKR
jgi:hypothetical protein